MSERFWVLAAVLAFSGCTAGQQQAEAPIVPGAPVTDAACNQDAGQFAVGQKATPSLLEEVRLRTGSKLVRRLEPGQPTTREFNWQRVNVRVDGGNVVRQVYCS